jgi:uncharacterized membrane protein
VTTADDPVRAQRARIAHWVSLGLRVGYLLFGAAMVLFFSSLAFGIRDWLVTTIIVCLFVGSAVLAPAIVFNYGVKAAERADRAAGR